MRRHLLEIFDDHQDAQDLRLELAAVVGAGVHFLSSTCYLEGDTPLIFSCCERLCSVAHAVAVEPYLNTSAVAREIAGGNAVTYNQPMIQATACIQPGLNFYKKRFSVQFRTTVRAFKVTRLCCPMHKKSRPNGCLRGRIHKLSIS